ncbi:hypothetical protein AVEN_235741-1 [Araneus ventricosus]|uniref:Uncharacterized protein n=1 Tax=Araneus ventricosus TaxID=182803 RepID=A0A4Y2TBI9_ARAVE|nr:hypothetical protein AVEN_235741-1 [Araneus ventricosus]
MVDAGDYSSGFFPIENVYEICFSILSKMESAGMHLHISDASASSHHLPLKSPTILNGFHICDKFCVEDRECPAMTQFHTTPFDCLSYAINLCGGIFTTSS